MGQFLGSMDDEMEDSADEAVEGTDIRKHALNAKRIAVLTWPDFVMYINLLNQKCKQLIDDQGKHLVFAVRKGSTDTYLWKATVQICCMKFNTIVNKPESYKLMNLPKFLRVYSSLIALIDEPADSSQDVAEGAPGPSGADGAYSLRRNPDLKASILLENVDALDSLAVRGQGPAAECVICMERQPDVVLPCSHAYCLPCIEQWHVDNHDCPTCRADIQSTDEAWIISDYPDKREFIDYLLQLTE